MVVAALHIILQNDDDRSRNRIRKIRTGKTRTGKTRTKIRNKGGC